MADEPVPTRSSGTDDTIPASDLDADPTPGSVPAADLRYKLGAELGRGGMGRVVEAYDTHLGRTVALKEVLPQGTPNITRRFQREVRITARLEHASIVPLYDSGVMADGRPFYVMRRVSGSPLDELMVRARGLDERLALLPNVLAAIDAIGHAHRRGVIHRDLKPGNILVGDLGETVVIDWGLAKVVGEEEPPPESFEPFVPTAGDSLKTQLGAVFGTPGFMAPEQARGDDLDARSDVYALGATLYQLMAGKPPIGGTSATEMIATTATKRVVPILRAMPSVPPELATIIDKALSFHADDRYSDASELAADVRRFTTGQLVGAHRYTRRQRIARFARRHRAALVVAAAAATAVAVLSWVSVHRILAERDAARVARREAEHARVIADTKAEEARQRADQLMLAAARGLIETNPTGAIAALKQLGSSSPQTLDGAKAIAKAAVARGVAWGMRSLPGASVSFEMTRDGRRLLQVSRTGELQILDLELRKQIVSKQIGSGNVAFWVDGDRMILIDRSKQPPAVFDPATGTIDTIGTQELKDLARTSDGKLVAFIDASRQAGVIDIATRSITMAPIGEAERAIAIADDGSWLAFGVKIDAKRGRLVIVDRAGKLLAERPGTPILMAVSPSGKLAVSMFDEVVEVRPGGAKPTFSKVPLEPKETHMIHQLLYTGELLHMVGARGIVTWGGVRLVRSESLGQSTYLAQVSASSQLVVTANDNNVHLLRDANHLVVPVFDASDGMYRVATGRETSRVAATTKEAILIWDTDVLFPRVYDSPVGVFIANRRMLVQKGVMGEWYIWDIDSDQRTPVKGVYEGLPLQYHAQADDGRAVVLVHTRAGMSVIDVRADGTSTVAIEDIGDKGHLRSVQGKAIVYTLGKNRIFGKLGNEPSRELVSLVGDVASLTSNGKLGYAALSKTGELVRGTFGGATFARTQLTDRDKGAFIIGGTNGDVFVASGHRLLRWRTDVHEVARFAAEIDFIASTELGLYVQLVNRNVLFVAATGNQTPQRMPVSAFTSASRDGSVVIGLSAGQQVEVVDMPSLAMWTLPRVLAGMPGANVSPDGQRIVQSLGMRVGIWRLAQPGSDFSAWLDELTNASEDAGHVRWPWMP
jgi:hypothetical protein